MLLVSSQSAAQETQESQKLYQKIQLWKESHTPTILQNIKDQRTQKLHSELFRQHLLEHFKYTMVY